MDQVREVSFQDIFSIISRRLLLFFVVFFVVVAAAVVMSFVIAPTYKGSAKIIIDNESGTALSGFVAGTSIEDSYLVTQREIMSSPGILKAAMAGAQDKGYLKNASYETVKRAVKVGYLNGSHVLEVGVYLSNPRAAAEMANAMVQSFFDYHTKARVDVVDRNLGAVSKAVESVKERMAALEGKLRSYSDKDHIAYYQSQVPMYVGSLISLDEKSLKSQEDNKRYEQELNKTTAIIDKGDPASFYPLLPQSGNGAATENPTSSLTSIPWIQDIKGKLVQVESEMSALSAEYTDNNPEVAKLRSKLAAIRLNLNQEMKRVLRTYADYYRGSIAHLESGQDANAQESTKYEAQLTELSAKIQQAATSQMEYMMYSKQYELLSEVYGSYAKRQGDLILLKEQAEAETFPNLRVFESAVVPYKPVSPNMPVNVAIGVALGLLIGMLACLRQESKEQQDDKLSEDNVVLPVAPARYDRRGMKRVVRDLTVVYKVEGMPVKKYATTSNISGTGICLEMKERVKERTDISLDIQIAHDEYIHPTGKILWVKPDHKHSMFQVGVNFESIVTQERDKLVNFLYGASALTP